MHFRSVLFYLFVSLPSFSPLWRSKNRNSGVHAPEPLQLEPAVIVTKPDWRNGNKKAGTLHLGAGSHNPVL